MKNIHIVAFTHRTLPVGEIGELHIAEENQQVRLTRVKEQLNVNELMFLSTCNRVEFVMNSDKEFTPEFLKHFLIELYPNFSQEQIDRYVLNAEVFIGLDAVEHLLRVASSVDSMIVGEREIITQVRQSFERCRTMGLTGDLIRILMRHTIETAKKVYTHTGIARKPVSVVSLAYHKLRDLNVPLDSRILIIGAGVTNTNMSKFLRKHGFTNFHVFNRTFSKAAKLAEDLGGIPHPLNDLEKYEDGFDIIITCTGSEDHLITPNVYQNLLKGETDKKIVIDIAIPQDLSPEIIEANNVTHISVEVLQRISNQNLEARSREIESVEEILHEALAEFVDIYHLRSVEIAMRAVPNKVKEIKAVALNEVFHTELNQLDDNSRETVEKIIGYMEKKYMSMPMVMAKEILLKKNI